MNPLEAMLEKMLRRDEGERLTVYTDSQGHPTIGVGRALDTKGISSAEADYLLTGDILDVIALAQKNFSFYPALLNERKTVLLSMLFQLGLNGVKDFTLFLEAVQFQNWSRAAKEMLDSKWHEQTPERVERLAKQMETGVYQP